MSVSTQDGSQHDSVNVTEYADASVRDKIYLKDWRKCVLRRAYNNFYILDISKV